MSEACAEYDRSLAGDEVNPVRTSTQCWCYEPCLRDPRVRRVVERAHALTESSVRTSEYMQIVKYTEGQFYRAHHDQNSASATPQGPRVLTFFMYLNQPEEGGATRFNDLGIDVQPLAGRALIWPSMRADSPSLTDDRTRHEALAVQHGVKHGANLWIHLYDWKTPSKRGCRLTAHNTI